MRVRAPFRVLVAAAILVCGAGASAQAPQLPPRDAGPPGPATGTAAIHGRVIDAQTRQPLRRARIALAAPELGRGGLSASTDDAGRYELTDLPAGRFTLSVERSGYLSLRYGQRRPNEQGMPLEVAAGQRLDDVDFALPRMAVISGRVVDELGEPIAGVWMTAQRYIYSDNRRRLMPDGPVITTDDEGNYRLTNLLPGTYLVNARTLDKWVVTEPGREAAMGYAPTYFPGVSDPANAQRVTVTSGMEAANTDMALVPGRAATISGMAVDSQGRPLKSVLLVHELLGTQGGLVGSAGNGAVTADGMFTIPAVPPGDYKLQATGPQELVVVPVSVNGVDVTNVSLTTSAGWTARGTVAIDSDTPDALRRSLVTVRAAPLAGRNGMGMSGGPVMRQAVNDDWTFVVSGIVGAARLLVNVPDGWAVKAVLQGDRDIADLPLDMRSGGELGGLQVVLTDRGATLEGDVRNAKGTPTTDGTVILFASDASRWYENSRFVRVTRPDQRGQYRIRGLLPGEYLAVALDYVEQGIWNDPEYLESLRRHAQKVSLGSATTSVPLMVATP
jgi:protocatechuate 3,4-dioxygenase beta subunit